MRVVIKKEKQSPKRLFFLDDIVSGVCAFARRTEFFRAAVPESGALHGLKYPPFYIKI